MANRQPCYNLGLNAKCAVSGFGCSGGAAGQPLLGPCAREGFVEAVLAPVGIPSALCTVRSELAPDDRPVTLWAREPNFVFAVHGRWDKHCCTSDCCDLQSPSLLSASGGTAMSGVLLRQDELQVPAVLNPRAPSFYDQEQSGIPNGKRPVPDVDLLAVTDNALKRDASLHELTADE